MNLIKRALKKIFRKLGYEITRVNQMSVARDDLFLRNFHGQSSANIRDHWEKTKETVLSLNKKYKEPVIGKVPMLDLLSRLARCIDPHDDVLGNVSQLTHALLIAEGMERDGITDPDLLIAALVHDLGKIVLLQDNESEEMACINTPLNDSENGMGLEHCIFQWNHGEFIYSRLKSYLPDHISWLIRYHSFFISDNEPFLSETERAYLGRYHRIFRKYDQGTKSVYKLLTRKLEDYQDLIDSYFPVPILF